MDVPGPTFEKSRLFAPPKAPSVTQRFRDVSQQSLQNRVAENAQAGSTVLAAHWNQVPCHLRKLARRHFKMVLLYSY